MRRLARPSRTVPPASKHAREVCPPRNEARQSETPEFKNWFGASKVVDADGKPLVVYHGTHAAVDFESFKRGRSKSDDNSFASDRSAGISFSDVPEAADYYAGYSGNSRTLPVHLSLKDPLIVDMESSPKSRTKRLHWQNKLATRAMMV